MAVSAGVLSITISIALFCAILALFIAFNLYRKVDKEFFQEYIKRRLIVILALTFFTGYTSFYNASSLGEGTEFLVLLGFVFSMGYILWSSLGLQKISYKYGMSTESKLDRMKNQTGRKNQ